MEPFSKTVVCKLQHASEAPGGLIKIQTVGSTPEFLIEQVEWGWGIGISGIFPGDAAAGPSTTHGELWF